MTSEIEDLRAVDDQLEQLHEQLQNHFARLQERLAAAASDDERRVALAEAQRLTDRMLDLLQVRDGQW